MSALAIKADCFGGVGIEQACSEAVRLCNQLQTVVEFSFNGVMCMAIPNTGSGSDLQKDWAKKLNSPHAYKIATSHIREGE